MEGKCFFPLADGEDDVRHAVHFDHGCSLGLEPYRLRGSRRLDQGPKGRVERPSLHDKPLIVETRSLHSALRAPVETTGIMAMHHLLAQNLVIRSISVGIIPAGKSCPQPGQV